MFVFILLTFACLSPKNVVSKPGIPLETNKETGQESSNKTNRASPSDLVIDSWTGKIYFENVENPKTLLIQNEQELSEFVDKIPSVLIQKTNPAPPSKDPLRNGKEIDFTTQMIAVALRFENMYATSDIISVNRGEAGVVVHVTIPPVGETAMYSSLMGVGTYSAVLIPSTQQPIRFAYDNK